MLVGGRSRRQVARERLTMHVGGSANRVIGPRMVMKASSSR